MDYDTWLLSGPGGPLDDDGPVACPECGGSGIRHFYIDEGGCDWEDCPACDGSGLIDASVARALCDERRAAAREEMSE